MHPEPRTVWRLTDCLDEQGRPRNGLQITLSVDTQAETVVKAIERAAAANDIRLERAD